MSFRTCVTVLSFCSCLGLSILPLSHFEHLILAKAGTTAPHQVEEGSSQCIYLRSMATASFRGVVTDQFIFCENDQTTVYEALCTAGGGACGIHAALGEITSDGGACTAANPRVRVRSLVHDCVCPSKSVEKLAQHTTVRLANAVVFNSLLAGHVNSLLLDLSEARPSREALLLGRQLHVDKLSHLIDEQKNAARDLERRTQEASQTRAELRPKLRVFSERI